MVMTIARRYKYACYPRWSQWGWTDTRGLRLPLRVPLLGSCSDSCEDGVVAPAAGGISGIRKVDGVGGRDPVRSMSVGAVAMMRLKCLEHT